MYRHCHLPFMLGPLWAAVPPLLTPHWARGSGQEKVWGHAWTVERETGARSGLL